MRYLVLISFLLGLSTAAPPIHGEQCAQVDRQEQGLEDGRSGYGEDRLTPHREARAGVEVAPDGAR